MPIITFYRVADEIPDFATGVVKYGAAELVQILLDNKIHISSKQPLRVTTSKVFIVDTDKLSHHDDLKADDLGSWRNDGQHSRWVKVKRSSQGVTKVELCGGKPECDSRAYCLHRHYFVHHSNSEFKRKIVFLTGRC